VPVTLLHHRIPEPELMDGAEQARAYARADFEEPNQRFVDLVLSTEPPLTGRALDLGCGPADIARRLARRLPQWRITGVDGSEAMLAHGRAALLDEPLLRPRIDLVQGLVPQVARHLAGDWDLIVSNSLLHHLHQPSGLWSCIATLGRPGTSILVVDLRRPSSEEQVEQLVVEWSADEPAILQRDFAASLRAAFRVEEVRAQLHAAGLGCLEVAELTDRHLVVSGQL
jgi:SAM-dependent methyltransferase